MHALSAFHHAAPHGLPTLADFGYDGVGIGIHIPVRQPAYGRELDIGTRNFLQRSRRCPGERGFALLIQLRLHQMKSVETTSIKAVK